MFIILKLLNFKTSDFKGYLHYALKTSTKAKDKENWFLNERLLQFFLWQAFTEAAAMVK